MRIWIARNPDCFESSDEFFPTPAWYGWAGDANICAVMAATSEQEARALLPKPREIGDNYADLDSFDEWTFEDVGESTATEPTMLLFAYGSY